MKSSPHRWLRLTLALALAACIAPLAFSQAVTLQQILSAPFSSSLLGAPHGHRFAWITNEQGRRNIWVAEAGAAGAHALTSYTADDGMELSGLAWAPDGATLFYVRGGDEEWEERPAPNPALLPGVIEQTIWKLSLHDGVPVAIGPGHSPAVSPDGATLAYLLKDQVWTVSLREPGAKPAQLFHGRGTFDTLVWSPDSRHLAFESRRGDHGFIGAYDFAAKQLSYLDPGTAHDAHPAWSPDSRQVAFVRVFPDALGVSFKPRRTAQPWSIRVVNVDGTGAHEVWHAAAGPGSVFHEAVGPAQLLWSADGHIAFPWEGDGWLHLYAVPAPALRLGRPPGDGWVPSYSYSVAASVGPAVLLTPGAFEVEHLLASPDGRTILYAGNHDDIDRRHLWSVGFTAGPPVQLTRGTGSEVAPAVSDGVIAALRSDAKLPGRPAIVGAGGELRDLAPQLIPKDFPAARLVVPEQVILRATDGMQIHAQLFLPAQKDAKPHAAVVFFHGGSRRQMLLGWHYMQYYHNAYAMNQYLASLGYVVLSVNYRSGIGYGLNFREALNYGAGGASEFNDVEGAGLYLAGRADVDPARIGVWGGSYGGYLTALALARASDLFAAGVDLHGVHDWNLEQGNWGAYNPAADPEATRLAWTSSPLYSVKDWRSPVLLIQGDDDRNVQFSQTVRLAAALRQQGVDFEEHVFPDEIHDFLLYRSWTTAYTLAADFFHRKLAPAPPR